MRKLIIIIPLLIGVLNATEVTQPKIEVTESGLKYALDKNYAQLTKFSVMSDRCFRELSEKKKDDLERCENYQQITKDIQARIERLEDLKRRFYTKWLLI